jgi:hypothetical protein
MSECPISMESVRFKWSRHCFLPSIIVPSGDMNGAMSPITVVYSPARPLDFSYGSLPSEGNTHVVLKATPVVSQNLLPLVQTQSAFSAFQSEP